MMAYAKIRRCGEFSQAAKLVLVSIDTRIAMPNYTQPDHAEKVHKCRNAHCHCLCQVNQEYCSGLCKNASDGTERCRCEHEKCKQPSGLRD